MGKSVPHDTGCPWKAPAPSSAKPFADQDEDLELELTATDRQFCSTVLE